MLKINKSDPIPSSTLSNDKGHVYKKDIRYPCAVFSSKVVKLKLHFKGIPIFKHVSV